LSAAELVHFGVNLGTKTRTFQSVCFNHLTPVIFAYTDCCRLLPLTIAFLDPENVDFDAIYAILLTFGSPHYALLCWCRPSWKMAPCVNRTHFRRCHHAVSWPPHLNDWF